LSSAIFALELNHGNFWLRFFNGDKERNNDNHHYGEFCGIKNHFTLDGCFRILQKNGVMVLDTLIDGRCFLCFVGDEMQIFLGTEQLNNNYGHMIEVITLSKHIMGPIGS
jgi:hypothetical protein